MKSTECSDASHENQSTEPSASQRRIKNMKMQSRHAIWTKPTQKNHGYCTPAKFSHNNAWRVTFSFRLSPPPPNVSHPFFSFFKLRWIEADAF